MISLPRILIILFACTLDVCMIEFYIATRKKQDFKNEKLKRTKKDQPLKLCFFDVVCKKPCFVKFQKGQDIERYRSLIAKLGLRK